MNENNKPVTKRVTIVIPSLNPDEKLKNTVAELESAGFDDIIVIDDGSADEYKSNFPDASDTVTRLTHVVNRGKGAAMKTAFAAFIARGGDREGVITVDGDGQHRCADVIACAEAMLDGKPALVLGCRNFDLPHVPERSRKGNKITSKVFKILFGMNVSDTQTGLRAIPTVYLPKIAEVRGDRYEYETNMLMALKLERIPYREVPIETVYINENEMSHFRPVRDSIRIYGLILKFLASSCASAVVDIVGFQLFQMLYIFLRVPFADYAAAISARVVSAIVNFTINKNAVFGGSGSTAKLFARYVALAVPMLAVSSVSVHYLGALLGGKTFVRTLIKIPIDTILFIVSFRVQREWVFGRDKNENIKGDNNAR